MTPPLLVTRDETLRDAIARLAAAGGSAPQIVADAPSALRAWAAADLVLVGADVVSEVAALGPPRRDRVHVLGAGASGDPTWREALAIGAESVVELPAAETWLIDTLTDLADSAENANRGSAGGRTFAVLGGSGGAGATTLACALGQYAARTGPSVVIDCDRLGPGVDRILGLEDRAGFRWDALAQTTGRLSSRSLREALPRRGGLGALSWRAGSEGRLSPDALREVLSAARRGHDVVVLDLPRCAESVVDEVVSRCDLTLLVLRSTVAGVASAARLRARLGDGTRVGLVLRGYGAAEADVARVVGAPVIAEMSDQRGLCEAIDLGWGPLRRQRGPLARVCGELLAS